MKALILRNTAVACWQAAPTVKLASLDIAELRAAPPPISAVLEQIRTDTHSAEKQVEHLGIICAMLVADSKGQLSAVLDAARAQNQ